MFESRSTAPAWCDAEPLLDVAWDDGSDAGRDDGWDDGWDGDWRDASEPVGPIEPPSDSDDAAGVAVGVGPGPWAAALLGELDERRLSPSGRLDALVAWQQLATWAEANAARLLVDHLGAAAGAPDVRVAGRLEESSALTEAALALRLSPTSVRARWTLASTVHSRLPMLAEAWRAGRVWYGHVAAVADVTAPLSEAAARLADARLADRATRLTPASLRRAARTVVTRLDPEAAQARIETAHADRRVTRFGTPEGETCLQVWAGPRDIQAIWAALTRLAGPQDTTDPRTLDNRRVDALLALCLAAVETTPVASGLDGGEPRSPVRRTEPPVQAHVVIDLATLLGLADNPAELPGYGSIPPTVARAWLADATTWRRLVTDPVRGHLLDYGPTVRTPPPRLAAYLNARDRTCTFPGCAQPAARTDHDHQPPWQPDGTGGRTSAADLACLCRHHHRLKTHGRWDLQRLSHGTSRWTSPSGRTFDVARPAILDRADDPDP